MRTLEARGFRQQILGRLKEYEGHLRRLEGQLLIVRGKADRAAGDAQVRLGSLVAEVEKETEKLREAGRLALEGLTRAAEVGQGYLDRLRNQVTEAEVAAPAVLAKGRAVVRRATIEAKALRHGVRVGLRVARRVSRRVKASKGE
jgi:uncharacterized protein YjbJ (UPF0337 family)